MLDAPAGLEFGIDLNCWAIDNKFQGLKLIPPGLHYVYWKYSGKYRGASVQNGDFRFVNTSQLIVYRWNTETEEMDFKSDDTERDNDETRGSKAPKIPMISKLSFVY